MRLRFTIRDLLWLTLIVGLIAGWCLDHLATAEMLRSERRHNDHLQRELVEAEGRISELTDPYNVSKANKTP